MRQPIVPLTHTDVDAGLSEMIGQELCMTVGHVKKGDLSDSLDVVKL
jgi:hypothetical protein